MTRRLGTASLAALTTLALLAGCSNGNADESADDPSSVVTVTETATTTPAESGSSTPATEDTADDDDDRMSDDDAKLFPYSDYLVGPDGVAEFDDDTTGRLSVPQGSEEGQTFKDGEVKLILEDDGKKLTADVPAGSWPMLFNTEVDAGDDLDLFLVLQTGGDAATYVPFAVFHDELVEVAVTPDAPFGSDTGGMHTWIGPDGDLFSAQGAAEGENNGTEKVEVFQWTQSPQDLLTIDPVSLGEKCIDWTKPEVVVSGC